MGCINVRRWHMLLLNFLQWTYIQYVGVDYFEVICELKLTLRFQFSPLSLTDAQPQRAMQRPQFCSVSHRPPTTLCLFQLLLLLPLLCSTFVSDRRLRRWSILEFACKCSNEWRSLCLQETCCGYKNACRLQERPCQRFAHQWRLLCVKQTCSYDYVCTRQER